MLYLIAFAISAATMLMLLLSVTHWIKRDVVKAMVIGTLGIFFLLNSTFIATVVAVDQVVKEAGIQQIFPSAYPDDQDPGCDPETGVCG